MILHVTTDNRFVDYAIKQFEEVLPGRNHYLVEVGNKNKELQYLKEAKNKYLTISGSKEYFDWSNKISQYELVVMHSLNGDRVKLINQLNSPVNIAWIPWGADIHYMKEDINLFQPQTLRLTRCLRIKRQIKLIPQRVYNIIKYGQSKEDQKIKALSNISFFLGREGTFNVVSSRFPNMKRFDYYYYNIQDTLGGCKNAFVDGDNILFGNSSTATNNHVDVLEVFSETQTEYSKIITPLAYGDMDYRKLLLKRCKVVLEQRFYPLLVNIPLDEYNRLLSTCKVVVMNHIRPQAFGNILTALWMGAKVYLNEKNSLLSFCQSLGLYVYSINEDLNSENKMVFTALNMEQMNHNREILKKYFSYDISVQRVREVINAVKR